MITPYSKIPRAGRRDWAGDLTAVLRNLITAVILLGLTCVGLAVAIVLVAVR